MVLELLHGDLITRLRNYAGRIFLNPLRRRASGFCALGSIPSSGVHQFQQQQVGATIPVSPGELVFGPNCEVGCRVANRGAMHAFERLPQLEDVPAGQL